MYKVCDVVFVSIERYEQILSQQFKEPFSFLAFYRLDGARKHFNPRDKKGQLSE